jgi:phosphoglucomutase
VKKLAAALLGLGALAITALAGSSMGHAQAPSADDAAWAAARDAGTAEAYQGYLEAFPAGEHAEEAFRRLIEGGLEIAPGAGQDFDMY